jgi:hypothetical protein
MQPHLLRAELVEDGGYAIPGTHTISPRLTVSGSPEI